MHRALKLLERRGALVRQLRELGSKRGPWHTRIATLVEDPTMRLGQPAAGYTPVERARADIGLGIYLIY